jgi:hypothetical protein
MSSIIKIELVLCIHEREVNNNAKRIKSGDGLY